MSRSEEPMLSDDEVRRIRYHLDRIENPDEARGATAQIFLMSRPDRERVFSPDANTLSEELQPGGTHHDNEF